jgi:hypothetical protein
VFKNHVQPSSFEDFSAHTYCPSYPAHGPLATVGSGSPNVSSLAAGTASSSSSVSGNAAAERKTSKVEMRSGGEAPGRPPRRSVFVRGSYQPTADASPPSSPKMAK